MEKSVAKIIHKDGSEIDMSKKEYVISIIEKEGIEQYFNVKKQNVERMYRYFENLRKIMILSAKLNISLKEANILLNMESKGIKDFSMCKMCSKERCEDRKEAYNKDAKITNEDIDNLWDIFDSVLGDKGKK